MDVYYWDFQKRLLDVNEVDAFDILQISDEMHYAILNKSHALFHFCLGLGYVDRIQVILELVLLEISAILELPFAFCECVKSVPNSRTVFAFFERAQQKVNVIYDFMNYY